MKWNPLVSLAALVLWILSGCTEWTETARVLPDAPSLSLSEVWKVDGSEALAGDIGWVVVAENGTIYVGHPGEGRIVALGVDGSPKGIFGRVGRELGEFQRMAHAGTLGDSLWVYDGLLRRVTVFGPDREVARSFIWPPPADRRTLERSGDATVPYLLGITTTGSIVSSVYRERGEGAIDLAAAGTPLDSIPGRRTLAAHPVPSGARVGGFAIESFRLFPIDPVFAAASNGASFTFVETRVDGPEAGTFVVTRFDAAGDTVFRRSHPYYPVEIPAAVADSAMRRVVRGLRARNGATPAVIDAYRDNVQVPPVFPPILGAVAGRDGSTWVRMRPLVEGNAEYYAIAPDGGLAGQLSLPGAMSIVAAEMTRVWVVATGSNGIDNLVAYDVEPLDIPSEQPR